MRVGIIQSSYLPWRGYFDFIDAVDVFVFHDDIQYTKGDWRNRNQFKTPRGLVWLTVPVRYRKTAQLICETVVDSSKQWQKKHLNLFKANYATAPFFKDALRLFEEGLTDAPPTIGAVNVRLARIICAYLRITTPFVMSSDLNASGSKTERLICLLEKLGAATYVSGPSAQSYLDESLFRQHGIALEYKSYDYPPYPQLWGEFQGTVSVLDLIANTGPEAGKFLKSTAPDRVALS